MTYSFRKPNRTEVHMDFIAAQESDYLNRRVLFPLTEVKQEEGVAFMTFQVKQMCTIVNIPALDGPTVNFTANVHAQVQPGAMLHLKINRGAGACTASFTTKFDANIGTIALPASATSFLSFVYDGDVFWPLFSLPS